MIMQLYELRQFNPYFFKFLKNDLQVPGRLSARGQFNKTFDTCNLQVWLHL